MHYHTWIIALVSDSNKTTAQIIFLYSCIISLLLAVAYIVVYKSLGKSQRKRMYSCYNHKKIILQRYEDREVTN